MKNPVLILLIFFAVGLGCKTFQLKDYIETPEEPPRTVITKDVLSERLTARFVTKADVRSSEKPNPLTLQIRFGTQNSNFILNQKGFDNFGKMAESLKQIFKDREQNGVFIEGTNKIYRKLTLPAYQKTIDEYNLKNITVEDFEKLVDDLRNEGFDQIEFDINEVNQLAEFPKTIERTTNKPPFDSETGSTKTDPPKTISGGVLNAKAVELPKPAYPAAARAVRASGAVNVQVTIDRQGNVLMASAVSGHPMLRASAVAAAREAKFKPTLLSGKPVNVSGIIVYNFVP